MRLFPCVLLVIAASATGLTGAEEALDPTDLLGQPTTPAETAPEKPKDPLPAPDAVKQATATIKDLYKSEYATSKGRAALISTLVDQALQTNDDPTLRYALLHEARELAIAGKQVATVIDLCEQIAALHAGTTAVEQQRAALGRLSTVPVVPHLLKLLDQPQDGLANTAVGRWYATEMQQWDHALPLLTKGSDPTLAKVAATELALAGKPAAEQAALADQWYELGKRTTSAKEAYWRHALGHYEQAKGRLSGLSVTVIEKRIIEIEAFLPLGPDTDYNALSAGQWDKLKGKVFTIDAAKGITTTTVVLAPGQQVRVVPHPTDTWKVQDTRDNVSLQTTWKGGMSGRRATGSLQCRVGTGIEQTPGVVTGSGPLTLFPLVGARRFVVTGSIRVKVLPVTE
jgi:hypothetical protein